MVNFVVEVVAFFVFEVKFVVVASFAIEVKMVVASFVIEVKMVEAFLLLLLLPPLIFFVSKRQSLKTLLARIQEQ